MNYLAVCREVVHLARNDQFQREQWYARLHRLRTIGPLASAFSCPPILTFGRLQFIDQESWGSIDSRLFEEDKVLSALIVSINTNNHESFAPHS